MKMTATIKLNLKTKEVSEKVLKSAREAMRDTVVNTWNEAVHHAPPPPKFGTYKITGHNRRSLVGEASGFGVCVKGEESKPEHLVDASKIEGAVYSTSGYGGYLETGTVKMDPRPYIRPAGDKEFTEGKFVERMKAHL